VTKDELLVILAEQDEEQQSNYEHGHSVADRALLAYINDPDISAAFEAVGKWYA
jgi:hypothetical protein